MWKLALAIATVLAATSCAGADSVSTTTETTEPVEPTHYALPTGSGDVVLRMMTRVNFPDPLPIVSRFPELTLYGDGRIILEDPERRRDPIPGLLEARISPEGMQLLVAEAAARGALDPLESYGSTGVADGNSTRFVVNTAEGEVGFSVYDLGRGGGPGGELTDEQIEARDELAQLRDALLDFESLVGPEVISGRQAVSADAVAVVGMSRGSDPAFELPFDLTADGIEVETRVAPVSCLIVTGDDLVDLTQIVSTLEPSGSGWPGLAGGQVWTLVFRPMLPDEAGCTELGSQ